nr:immunoglobulin light chain junction region [Macaca mulatta]MOW69840.1 immunoglobulin light chain junction region [Macaca mulatta]
DYYCSSYAGSNTFFF